MSNVEAALHLEMGPQTARNILAELEANGIASMQEGPKTRRGPRAKLYSISPAWGGKA